MNAKKFATRAAQKGVANCMQAMGADGYKHDYPLARHLACARMANSPIRFSTFCVPRK